MSSKNTIVIKSNPYQKEVKYFWKNADGTLSDLAETKSPFSKSRPEYKKLSNAILADIADYVVKIIDEEYNELNGVHIEVEGVEADYVAVQKVIEKNFSGKRIDCKWNKRMENVSEKMLADIKRIFQELSRALVEYDRKGVIKLGKENDSRGWLQYGFTWKHVTDESVHEAMRELAMGYLDTVIKEIRTEKENSMRMVEKLGQEWKQERERAAEIEKITADKRLKELVGEVLCNNEKRQYGKQLDEMLDKFCKQNLLDEAQIADRIKGAEQYALNHKEEWRKNISISKVDFGAGGVDKEQAKSAYICLIEDIERTTYIKERLVKVFNNELQQYAVELNEKLKVFSDDQAEELKKKILEKVYHSDKFTEPQKELIRQYIMDYGNVRLPYCTFKGCIIEKKQFQWMKKSSDSYLHEKEKKAICREYIRKLKNEFKDMRKDISKKNDKIFDKLEDEILKNLKADTEEGQMQKKLDEYSKKRDKFIRLEEKFVDGRNKIEAMVFI